MQSHPAVAMSGENSIMRSAAQLMAAAQVSNAFSCSAPTAANLSSLEAILHQSCASDVKLVVPNSRHFGYKAVGNNSQIEGFDSILAYVTENANTIQAKSQELHQVPI